jgi:protoporphyrinogen oxidase
LIAQVVLNSRAHRDEIAIIIGAGPAGLTAAYELLKQTKIKPVVLERSQYLGGLARTVNYKGNRIDMGGHRFFSKSDRVMNWWLEMMPLEATDEKENFITYRKAVRKVAGNVKGPDPEKSDEVMLLRNRRSRIYFMRKFFDYPISLSVATLHNLGILKSMKIGLSYFQSMLFPIKPERNLSEFFVNRFGKELYDTFFKSYTEKVWGVPCSEISAAWGAQRVKGLSLLEALRHFFSKIVSAKRVQQKSTETSLIEQFLYPKLGSGQMWELVADKVRQLGGEIKMNREVTSVASDGNKIVAVEVKNLENGEVERYEGDYFFSTMAIKDFVRALKDKAPANVKEVSEGLSYRDFITVGLLVSRLTLKSEKRNGVKLISDNWIYIQEPDVQLGRLQIFNNWSPYLVADRTKVWLGLEYFCNEGDYIWGLSDQAMVEFAVKELESIGIIKSGDLLDSTVIRMPKTHPGYFGTYERFDEIKHFMDSFDNLYPIGRNGMHKYNNQDHAMLTAIRAVENIAEGIQSKDNIWSINTESEYHEEVADANPD